MLGAMRNKQKGFQYWDQWHRWEYQCTRGRKVLRGWKAQKDGGRKVPREWKAQRVPNYRNL